MAARRIAPSMIGVAGGARRRKFLRCVMHGTVMAGQAFLVGDFFAEKSHCVTWHAAHCFVSTACAEDKSSGGVHARSLRTAVPR